MATQDPPSERTDQPAAPTPVIRERTHGIVERYREHRAERKRARLISLRKRRLIVRWLRRTAIRANEPHPLTRRRETLLHYRVAAVRTELVEIAATLERAHDPDPASVAALHDLLANGCDSPLYNPEIHISELQATLHYIRVGLAPSATYDAVPTRPVTVTATSTRDPTRAGRKGKKNCGRLPSRQRDA